MVNTLSCPGAAWYELHMQNLAKLEDLFDKVRAMPASQQALIAEALAELTTEPYQLSDDELRVLTPALDGVGRGEFAAKSAVDAVLHTPWTKSRSL
jgi:hypothetical protein